MSERRLKYCCEVGSDEALFVRLMVVDDVTQCLRNVRGKNHVLFVNIRVALEDY